jgi:hypothetical protein
MNGGTLWSFKKTKRKRERERNVSSPKLKGRLAVAKRTSSSSLSSFLKIPWKMMKKLMFLWWE